MANVFSLRNTYGAGIADRERSEANALRMRAGEQDLAMNERAMAQQEAQFDEQKQIENTGWVVDAARAVLENPSRWQGFVREGKRRGIVRPDFNQPFDENQVRNFLSVAEGALGATTPKPERKIVKGADGFQYYEDTKERVLPGVERNENTSQTAFGQDWALYQKARETDPELAEEMLKFKRGEDKPSSGLEKRLFEVNDEAFKAQSNVERYNNLADEMIRVNPASGAKAKWTESLKSVTGSEDAVTQLRKQWNDLRVSAAVQNLPPGVASDKDIELVMSAFLPEFANPETVASFMRGLAKLEKHKAEYHNFEAEYLSKNRTPIGLSKAWRERVNQAGDAVTPTGRTATNPQTGEKLREMSDGTWQ